MYIFLVTPYASTVTMKWELPGIGRVYLLHTASAGSVSGLQRLSAVHMALSLVPITTKLPK